MKLKAGEYTLRELLIPIFVDGKCVYKSPEVMEIQAYCRQEMDSLWEENKRLDNPHTFPVDISDKLYNLRRDLIAEFSKGTPEGPQEG
jgi:nicotinate phosphoribosyltransferase